jgi:tetratricopeptide (TPR) repeat protein
MVALIVLAVGAAGGAAEWHSERAAREVALTRARTLVDRGFFTLASRILEPYAEFLTANEDGCRLFPNALYGARRMAPLIRFSQLCVSHGFDTAEAHLGVATADDARGNRERALTVLRHGLHKFEKNANLARALAQVLRHSGKDDEAVAAYLDAAQWVPLERTDFSYEALSYFSELGLWKEARLMAERLKPGDLPDPERSLVIAHALERGGAPKAAEPWLARGSHP